MHKSKNPRQNVRPHGTPPPQGTWPLTWIEEELLHTCGWETRVIAPLVLPESTFGKSSWPWLNFDLEPGASRSRASVLDFRPEGKKDRRLREDPLLPRPGLATYHLCFFHLEWSPVCPGQWILLSVCHSLYPTHTGIFDFCTSVALDSCEFCLYTSHQTDHISVDFLFPALSALDLNNPLGTHVLALLQHTCPNRTSPTEYTEPAEPSPPAPCITVWPYLQLTYT